MLPDSGSSSHPAPADSADNPADPVPVATDPGEVHRTPAAVNRRNLRTVLFARALGRAGWYTHQHYTDVFKYESSVPGALPVALPLSPEAMEVVSRIQSIVDSQCMVPPPTVNPRVFPWDHDGSGGLHLHWASDQRPSERSPTHTYHLNHADSAVVWRTLVAEIADGWADTSTPGLSAGRIFLGPRNRLIFWPRHLNLLLQRLHVRYGSILDMFAIAAICGVKVDLKAAYRSLRISDRDARYHAALVDGIWIIFRRLSFGMAESPVAFVTVLDATLSRWRQSMPATTNALSQFVDDSGQSGTSILRTLLGVESLLLALRDDGWWFSAAKIFVLPAIRLPYTGFIARFDDRAIALRSDKTAKALDLLLSIVRPSDTALGVPSSGASPSRWFDPKYRLPPGYSSRPLPDVADVVLPPRRGDRLELTDEEAFALSRVVGYLCWFSVVVTFMAPWRLSLSILERTSRWTPELADTYDHVAAALQLASGWERPVDPVGVPLVVVVDSSGTGWGAIVQTDGGSPIYLAGNLPASAIGSSSTLREAAGAFCATQAAISRGLRFGHIVVYTDSQPLVGSSGGRVRSPAVADALAGFSALAVQGLHTFFIWQRRSTPSHVIADGLSSAARPAPWALRPEVLSMLWSASGGWDVDVVADEDSSTVAAYATPSLDLPSDRASALQGLIPVDASAGWQGTTASVRLEPDVVAFALPLWSEIRLVVEAISSGRITLAVVVAPTTPDAFWAPHLAALQRLATASVPLGRSASTPPRPGATRDPRPLSAYFVGFPPSRASNTEPPTRRHRPRWWTPWLLAADGDVELHPGPDTASPARHNALFGRRPPPQHRPPPPLPRPPPQPPPRAASAAAGCRALPHAVLAAVPRTVAPPPAAAAAPDHHTVVDAHADAYRALFGRPPASAAPRAPPPRADAPPARVVSPRRAPPPPPRPTRRTAAHAPPPPAASPPPAAACDAPRGTARPAPAPPAPSVRDWLLDILRVHGGRSARTGASTAGAGATAHAAARTAAQRATCAKAVVGSAACIRVAQLALELAAHRGVLDYPLSPDEADDFALDYALCRCGDGGVDVPPGWKAVSKAQAAEETSTLAAASRRAGHSVPPHCGPATTAWCKTSGAGAKSEHSKAFPLHVSTLLRFEPVDRTSRDWQVWAALIVASMFCLRTGTPTHLYSRMFIPYDGGFVFVWRHVHKRTAAVDSADPDALSAIGSITAARHPVLRRILDPLLAAPGNNRLFPNVTTAEMSAFVRRHVPGAPEGFSLRAYGTRVGADQDATELRLPDDHCDTLFAWKRSSARDRMRHYYSGLNIAMMFAFSDRRTHIKYTPIAAGRYDGRIPYASLRNWDDVGVGSDLPEPPSWTAIADAMRASAPSLIVARATRAEARRVRARRAAGEDSTSSAEGELPDSYDAVCCGCAAVLGPDDDATACGRCRLVKCRTCCPPGTPFRCPAHQPARQKRRTGR